MSRVEEYIIKPGDLEFCIGKKFALLYLLIHVLRSISRHQIHLFGTITVMTQSGVVLKAIARAILVHWLMGNKLREVWGAYSVCDLHACGQRLPRVIRSLPPASTLQQNMYSINTISKKLENFFWNA